MTKIELVLRVMSIENLLGSPVPTFPHLAVCHVTGGSRSAVTRLAHRT